MVLAPRSRSARALFPLGFVLAGLLPGVLPAESAPIAFENVTLAAIDEQADSDYRFDALWTDFNGDGCPDPFVFGHADPATSRLWLNRCDGSGRFTLVGNDAVGYYINPPETPLGAGWTTLLDIDGDGREDFWLRHANMMAARYRNGSARGAFVPRFSGKAEACDDPCVFGDIDGDGTLEIIHPDRRVVGILDGKVRQRAAGTAAEAIVFDVDGDGWPDIVQPGAGGWWRNRDGALDWVEAGLAGDQPAFAADLDTDGDLDLVTVTTGEGGRVHLFANDGRGGFTDVTTGSGLELLPVLAWWTEYGNRIAADLDNDGRPDLVMTSFERRRQVLLMRNLGGLKFQALPIDLGPSGQGSEGFVSRADLADYDFDGRLDLVKTQAGSNLGLWRNVSTPVGHWQQVRVRGSAGNSDGVGTALRWHVPGEDRLIAYEVVQIGNQHPRRVVHAGLGAHDRADLVVHFPHGGPAYRYHGLASNQALIVFANGCLLEGWRPGKGWPLAAPATCDRQPERESSAKARAGAGPLAALVARLAATATQTAVPPASGSSIELIRNGADGDEVAVTFGIPLPPGALADARLLRILDGDDNEIPARVEPTLRWHFKDDSIRAVKVQLRLAMTGERMPLRFVLGQPRDAPDPEPWPYAQGLVDGEEGVKVPGVIAVLDPAWLSASQVAGLQAPASRSSRRYDAFFARQFQWAQPLPVDDPIAFLFDRSSALFKQYVRTGDADYLRAAIASHRFYMGKLVRDGDPASSRCGGGWSVGTVVNPCDVKFVYIEPILLHLALTGDDTLHDDALIGRMATLWDLGGWSGVRGAYTRPDQHFTERHAGLGLVALVNAFQLTGKDSHRRSVDDRIGWLHAHLQANPDGLPDEGCWRHSWQVHEGNDYDPASDIRGCSPWMSENLIDGLWQAWQVTGDERIPPMITGFGRWLEQHGWIDTAALKAQGHDWRNPCSGADGQIPWYFGSSQVALERLVQLQESDGWYSDAHTVQMALPVAAARYFERDPVQARALERRLDRIEPSYAVECAASAATPRRFNWNHRGSGAVQWLRQNAPAPAGGE
jgi:hypothetical protein